MSLLSRLFGGGNSQKQDLPGVDYEGFTITPCPAQDGSQYRIQARITKDVDGTVKEHTLIRADTVGDAETAANMSTSKAKQLIDEQGEALFR